MQGRWEGLHRQLFDRAGLAGEEASDIKARVMGDGAIPGLVLGRPDMREILSRFDKP